MFKLIKKSELFSIYTMQSIQGLAFSMIGIFIPIYLLTLGYSVPQTLIFFIMHYGFIAIFAFLAIYIASRIGLERTIIIRFPFTLIYLTLLFYLQEYDIPLGLIAFFSGLESALYWIPLHILFARNTKTKNVGSATGKLFAFPQIASIAGPVLGGFIAALFGFKYLIGLVFIILLCSIVPLLNFNIEKGLLPIAKNQGWPFRILIWGKSLSRDLYNLLPVKSSFQFEIKQGIKLFKKYPRFFFAEIFDNIGEETEAIIWPIFIFLSLANIAAIGMVGSLLSFGSIIFTLLIGKFSDQINKKTLIKLGALLLFLVWFVRYFVQTEFNFFILTVLAGFFMVLLLVPYTSLVYDAAKKDKTDEYLVFREIPVFIGRAIILVFALLVVTNLKLSFLAAGTAYLYFFFF